MNTPTPIQEIFDQPTYHFWHLEQEYFIYLNVDSEKEPRMIMLATPEARQEHFVAREVLRSQAWEIAEASNIKEGIETIFLPKVNEYLASLDGGDNSFPVDGSDLEQYNWIVENALSYSNGKVTMI